MESRINLRLQNNLLDYKRFFDFVRKYFKAQILLLKKLVCRSRIGIQFEASQSMIRKLTSGEYRLYSRKKDAKTSKRRNLGTFKTRVAAEKHEREVQYFKRQK